MKNIKKDEINEIKIVEIDSCEYLWGDWGNATVLTHKGNCKYCKQKNNRRNTSPPKGNINPIT